MCRSNLSKILKLHRAYIYHRWTSHPFLPAYLFMVTLSFVKQFQHVGTCPCGIPGTSGAAKWHSRACRLCAVLLIPSNQMSKRKSFLRDGVVSMFTYLFMIGGAWLFVILLRKVINYYFPDLLPLPNLSLTEILLVLIIIFFTLFFGMLTGLLFLLTIVRPFYSKEEMIEFIKPNVPILSTILLKHIDSMYS